MYEAERERGDMPRFKHYFRVANLPYELDQFQTISVVSELLSAGAVNIAIALHIEDENQAQESEPQPSTDEVLIPTINT